MVNLIIKDTDQEISDILSQLFKDAEHYIHFLPNEIYINKLLSGLKCILSKQEDPWNYAVKINLIHFLKSTIKYEYFTNNTDLASHTTPLQLVAILGRYNWTHLSKEGILDKNVFLATGENVDFIRVTSDLFQAMSESEDGLKWMEENNIFNEFILKNLKYCDHVSQLTSSLFIKNKSEEVYHQDLFKIIENSDSIYELRSVLNILRSVYKEALETFDDEFIYTILDVFNEELLWQIMKEYQNDINLIKNAYKIIFIVYFMKLRASPPIICPCVSFLNSVFYPLVKIGNLKIIYQCLEESNILKNISPSNTPLDKAFKLKLETLFPFLLYLKTIPFCILLDINYMPTTSDVFFNSIHSNIDQLTEACQILELSKTNCTECIRSVLTISMHQCKQNIVLEEEIELLFPLCHNICSEVLVNKSSISRYIHRPLLVIIFDYMINMGTVISSKKLDSLINSSNFLNITCQMIPNSVGLIRAKSVDFIKTCVQHLLKTSHDIDSSFLSELGRVLLMYLNDGDWSVVEAIQQCVVYMINQALPYHCSIHDWIINNNFIKTFCQLIDSFDHDISEAALDFINSAVKINQFCEILCNESVPSKMLSTALDTADDEARINKCLSIIFTFFSQGRYSEEEERKMWILVQHLIVKRDLQQLDIIKYGISEPIRLREMLLPDEKIVKLEALKSVKKFLSNGIVKALMLNSSSDSINCTNLEALNFIKTFVFKYKLQEELLSSKKQKIDADENSVESKDDIPIEDTMEVSTNTSEQVIQDIIHTSDSSQIMLNQKCNDSLDSLTGLTSFGSVSLKEMLDHIDQLEYNIPPILNDYTRSVQETIGVGKEILDFFDREKLKSQCAGTYNPSSSLLDKYGMDCY